MGHRGDDRNFVDQDEVESELRKEAPRRRFREFDCPSCNANNPTEEFGDGAELLCNYCGISFVVKMNDEGRMRLREI